VESEEVGQDRGRDVFDEGDEGRVAGRAGVDAVVQELAAEPGLGCGASGQQAREEPARSGPIDVDPGLSTGAFGETSQERGELGRDQQWRRADVEVQLTVVFLEMPGVEVPDA